MSATSIVTHYLREALWAVAAAGVVLTSTGVAGVHQTACSSATTAANAVQPANQFERPGLGLLALVRHLANVQPDTQGSTTPAQKSQGIEQLRGASQEALSDQALRERIARYRVSPEQDQRHVALPNVAQDQCSD